MYDVTGNLIYTPGTPWFTVFKIDAPETEEPSTPSSSDSGSSESSESSESSGGGSAGNAGNVKTGDQFVVRTAFLLLAAVMMGIVVHKTKSVKK